MIAGVNASLRLSYVDLRDCWHQSVIQAGQPGLMQGADEVNVGFGIHLSLCLWGSIEAEQPTFMQGILEVISFLPDPQYRHLGICIRFGAFPGVLGGRWERLGGFRWLSRRTHEAPGKLLGRSRRL